MSDDQRVYSDEEFALVLRQAAELASQSEPSGTSSSGLTLTEMKAVAAQVGIDPVLVERAAWMLAAKATATPFDRLIGGPLRLNQEARFPNSLDETSAARLLSAVRIHAGLAGTRDVGHSSEMGITWHDGGDLQALRVTARPEQDSTTVSVALDRRGTLGVVALVSGMSMFFAVMFAVFALYPESPALGLGGFVVGIGVVLAAARGYWSASTRRARERISGVMDAIGQTLPQPETQVAEIRRGGDGAAAPQSDASVVADTGLARAGN